MLTFSTNTPQAQTQLRQALEEPYTVKMLIFGNSPAIVSIAEKAQTREGALSVRRVVWVQDPQLLTTAEFKLYRKGSGDITVCTINIQGQVVAFLRSEDADSLTALERAFAAAQQQSGK